jgi:hypothetical protein
MTSGHSASRPSPGRSVKFLLVFSGFELLRDTWPYFLLFFWNRAYSATRGGLWLLLVTPLLEGVTRASTLSLAGPHLPTHTHTQRQSITLLWRQSHVTASYSWCRAPCWVQDQIFVTVRQLRLFKIKITLRRTVSRRVSLGVKPHLGPKTRFLLVRLLRFCRYVLPLWRMFGSVIYRGHDQYYSSSVFTILHVGILHSQLSRVQFLVDTSCSQFYN